MLFWWQHARQQPSAILQRGEATPSTHQPCLRQSCSSSGILSDARPTTTKPDCLHSAPLDLDGLPCGPSLGMQLVYRPLFESSCISVHDHHQSCRRLEIALLFRLLVGISTCVVILPNCSLCAGPKTACAVPENCRRVEARPSELVRFRLTAASFQQPESLTLCMKFVRAKKPNRAG